MNSPEYQRQWRKANPDKTKQYTLKYANKAKQNRRLRLYGISENDYQILVIQQKNMCAICDVDFEFVEIHVDHNHKSGKIRGLLCEKCNRGLGFFNDSPEVLRNAEEYLNENS